MVSLLSALELHEMNRNMKEHRHHMEVKLRKELVSFN
jgi:hypothetical protein